MAKSEVEKYARRLHSRLPLIGGMLRRSACRRLAEDGSAAAVPHLVQALDSDDEQICQIAEEALRSLTAFRAVDALCALWVNSRDGRLGDIVRECRYVATQPVTVRVLSALQAGQLEQAGTSAEGVPVLVDALTDDDGEIAERAGSALRSLTQQAAVDALCALWAKSRDNQLGDVVRECRYVAERPAEVQLLSALKAGIRVHAKKPAGVRPLVLALADQDREIAGAARAALCRVSAPDVLDALCELAITDPAGPAAEIVREQHYQHSVVSRRCVLFVLTGQIERYLELDFESQNLRAEYEAADDALRQRIAQTVRQSGDTRLLGLFRTGAIRKRALDLSRQEAEVVVDVYSRNERWEEIFGLLFHMPIASAIEALRLLDGSGWRPDAAPDAAVLDELIASAQLVGELPPPPPPSELALGPVFGQWIARGQSGSFRSASVDALRQQLREGVPPDAVAALSALSARGVLSADDIEMARTHRHWPVRVGCLALCEIAPEFAFSDTPTGAEGGGMWIEMLAPPLLYSAAIECRALHLTPEQVEGLGVALASVDDVDTQRAACGRVLRALGAHHLRHTIEVDDEMIVNIEETDIEIEG